MLQSIKRPAFSLIEMLITLAVLGVLIGLTVTFLYPGRNIDRANDDKEFVEINQLEARMRDWQIGGGQLVGITDRWQPICRYKEVPGGNDPSCVSFDGLQDDGYVDIIPFRRTSKSPFTGYEARSAEGIVQVRSMFWPRDIPGLVLWLDAAERIYNDAACTVAPEMGPPHTSYPSPGSIRCWKDISERRNSMEGLLAMDDQYPRIVTPDETAGGNFGRFRSTNFNLNEWNGFTLSFYGEPAVPATGILSSLQFTIWVGWNFDDIMRRDIGVSLGAASAVLTYDYVDMHRHFIIRYNPVNSSLQLFIDGNLVDSKSLDGPATVQVSELYIGGEEGLGILSDLHLYNKVLSESEMEALQQYAQDRPDDVRSFVAL